MIFTLFFTVICILAHHGSSHHLILINFGLSLIGSRPWRWLCFFKFKLRLVVYLYWEVSHGRHLHHRVILRLFKIVKPIIILVLIFFLLGIVKFQIVIISINASLVHLITTSICLSESLLPISGAEASCTFVVA